MSVPEIYRPEDADAVAARIQAATGTEAVIPPRHPDRGVVMEFVTAEMTTLEREGDDWIVVDTERGRRAVVARTDGFSTAVRLLTTSFAPRAKGVVSGPDRAPGTEAAPGYELTTAYPPKLTWPADERGSWIVFTSAGALYEAEELTWFMDRSIEDIARILADRDALLATVPYLHAQA